jgi:poly-beta-1,6-N-acetyl-D-glucosamine synthase
MMVLLYISATIVIAYALLILYCWYTYTKLPKQAEPLYNSVTKFIRVSIIIPARNEEKNIGKLLQAIINQQHVQKIDWEIIVVNDNSTDKTEAVVNSFNNKNIHCIPLQVNNAQAGHKKLAITQAISLAKGNIIITTDADCLPEANWLSSLHPYLQRDKMAAVAAPVYFFSENTFINIFQQLDFLILQGLTAVAVHNKWFAMANGANFAFSKAVFEQVNGYDDNKHLSSGDDVFLLQKIMDKAPEHVYYVNNYQAAMGTAAETSWKGFIQQRIRWSSKAKAYTNTNILITALLVYLCNVVLLGLGISSFFNPFLIKHFLILLGIKTLADWIYVVPILRFYKKNNLHWLMLPLQIPHIIYTVAAASFGFIGTYTWKGRQVK